MRIVTDLRAPVWPGERAVITIGAYDGVHPGHQAVIAQVCALANAQGARSAVVTFDRHPASVVRPESAPRLLTDAAQRLELLAATGVDATVVVPFDAAQSQESPADFVERVLVGVLATKVIVVGEDFHFGRDRAGNVALLTALGGRFDFEVRPIGLVPRADGEPGAVSSTSIRRALAAGDVQGAARLLGRLHEVRGQVGTGDQRGRTIGFPTANVRVPASIHLPADGVYAGWYLRPDGSRHAAAINIGRRPTFYEQAELSLLEAHLIDTTVDLYGELGRVQFVTRLRNEQRFEGIDALKEQLGRDIDAARSALTTTT